MLPNQSGALNYGLANPYSSLLGSPNVWGYLTSQYKAEIMKQLMQEFLKDYNVQGGEVKTTINSIPLYHAAVDKIFQSLDDAKREEIRTTVLNALGKNNASSEEYFIALYNELHKAKLIPEDDRQQFSSLFYKLHALNAMQEKRAEKKLGIWSGLGVALYMGGIAGIMDCMERVMSEVFGRIIKKVPDSFSFISRLCGKGYNKLCNRPDPLISEELLIWETTFEGVINAVCEQSATGNIMLKNIRVSDEREEIIADTNWEYLVLFMEEVFSHIINQLEAHLPYYAGDQTQRKILVTFANGLSIENKKGIAFMMSIIIKNLNHCVTVCKKAESNDDLDVHHLKKIARTTLLLFRKLRSMGDGDPKNSNANFTQGLSQGLTSGQTGGYLDW